MTDPHKRWGPPNEHTAPTPYIQDQYPGWQPESTEGSAQELPQQASWGAQGGDQASPPPHTPPMGVPTPETSCQESLTEQTPYGTEYRETVAGTHDGPPGYLYPAPYPYPPYGIVPPPKSFVIAWLLSLLLGLFGADRFYLGKTGTAVLKLVTLGGFGVWYLVDLVVMLTGNMTDKDGILLEGYEQNKTMAWIVSVIVIVFGLAL